MLVNEFTVSKTNAIMNFSIKYCDSEIELLNSDSFKIILKKYIEKLVKYDHALIDYFTELTDGFVEKEFLELFKLLLTLDVEEIEEISPTHKAFLQNKSKIVDFVEGLYSYWRRLERYAVIRSKENNKGIQNVNFVEETNKFTNLVLKTYRVIEQKLIGDKFNVYRQLPAGINVGLVLNDMEWEKPKGYESLNDIVVIDSIVLRPPFITYPNNNTRSGLFEPVDYNPLVGLELNSGEYLCYPAKIGESLAYVYCHRYYLSQGVSLCNLFELAKREEYMNKKPDIVYVYGVNDGADEKRAFYHHDKENDIYVGYANNVETDYFGYMKKMLLTLHNVKMINHGHLPIHGAMVNIMMKNGRQANVVIIGDSGAGKSESLEAFRVLAEDYLKQIVIIFDDMGTFKLVNNDVIGYGTEIGAFIRLDDLDDGYAYKEMDRAIFMSPNKINARLIMPVSSFEDITVGYPVDIVLYANNYDSDETGLDLFASKEQAIEVFKQGRRKAKGTTSEDGLVDSYFANPFGCVQNVDKTDILIEDFFSKLYANNIPVGQLYTKLGVNGMEQKGPKEAAVKLFEWIKENK